MKTGKVGVCKIVAAVVNDICGWSCIPSVRVKDSIIRLKLDGLGVMFDGLRVVLGQECIITIPERGHVD